VTWAASTNGSRGPVGIAVVDEVAVEAGGDSLVVTAPSAELGVLGGDVHAATPPATTPPSTARRVTLPAPPGPSIDRG